jgi:hypothetical protein
MVTPVSGATVRLRRSESAAPATDVDRGRCTTDEIGRYDVSAVLAAPEPLVLRVESPDFATYVRPNVELRPDENQLMDISLQRR